MAKHRKGTLTSARETAKYRLNQMPFGTRVLVGYWMDTGKYEAKTGGMHLHERFRPVEMWTSVPRKTGSGKKMVKQDIPAGRRNPSRGKSIPEYLEVARQQKKIGEMERMKRRSGLTGGPGKKSAKASRTPRDYGRNPVQGDVEYTLEPTHISRVRVGDVILRDGDLKTVGSKNIKRGGTGITLFGDSYKLGNEPVMVAQIKHSKPKKRNPMQSLNSVKALGDYSVRLDGTQVLVYARGGAKVANHYYPSEGTAQAGYRRLTSVKKVENWIKAHPSKKSNPSRGTRWRMDDGQIVTTDQLKRKFMGKLPTPAQRRMLGIRKVAPVKNPRTLPDARTFPLWWVGLMDKSGAIPKSKWKRVRALSRQGAVKQFLQKAKGLGPRLDKGEVLHVHVSDGKRMHPTGVPLVTTSYAIRKDD